MSDEDGGSKLGKVFKKLQASQIFILIIVGFLYSTYLVAECSGSSTLGAHSKDSKSYKLPDWSQGQFIYEVNVRQFSNEGNFTKVKEALPRLKEMGVGVLWLMPIHPIGELNRKGSLGSYYSIQDYFQVSSEFGGPNQLKDLIVAAHQIGIKVILDWVANHTSWDNEWTRSHRDFYKLDSNGDFVPPVEDWKDVIALNYDNQDLRHLMIEAMEYFIKVFDVDGFRCDVAGMVPTSFWNEARVELEKQGKQLLMLAESDKAELHYKAFDLTYSWDLYSEMKEVAKGKSNGYRLWAAIDRQRDNYPKDSYHLQFTSNHDENSWGDLVLEKMGSQMGVFIVLSATLPGIPLIYSGQEAGLDRSLEFFDKDVIPWRDHPFKELYQKLGKIKRENKALDVTTRSSKEGDFIHLKTTEKDHSIVVYKRVKGESEVVVFLNASNNFESFTLQSEIHGKYREPLMNYSVNFNHQRDFYLHPWQYLIFIKEN